MRTNRAMSHANVNKNGKDEMISVGVIVR
jgi:hypothetical protein